MRWYHQGLPPVPQSAIRYLYDEARGPWITEREGDRLGKAQFLSAGDVVCMLEPAASENTGSRGLADGGRRGAACSKTPVLATRKDEGGGDRGMERGHAGDGGGLATDLREEERLRPDTFSLGAAGRWYGVIGKGPSAGKDGGSGDRDEMGVRRCAARRGA